jgi:hypothetical protein
MGWEMPSTRTINEPRKGTCGSTETAAAGGAPSSRAVFRDRSCSTTTPRWNRDASSVALDTGCLRSEMGFVPPIISCSSRAALARTSG